MARHWLHLHPTCNVKFMSTEVERANLNGVDKVASGSSHKLRRADSQTLLGTFPAPYRSVILALRFQSGG